MPGYRISLLALACVAACNNEAAGENNRASTVEREAAAPAPKPSPYKAGQMLRVLRKAPCTETGPKASEEPWDMKVGSFVTYVRPEGTGMRVETAPGLECVIATDALGPA